MNFRDNVEILLNFFKFSFSLEVFYIYFLCIKELPIALMD